MTGNHRHLSGHTQSHVGYAHGHSGKINTYEQEGGEEEEK